jgi:hypothetical protein
MGLCRRTPWATYPIDVSVFPGSMLLHCLTYPARQLAMRAPEISVDWKPRNRRVFGRRDRAQAPGRVDRRQFHLRLCLLAECRSGRAAVGCVPGPKVATEFRWTHDIPTATVGTDLDLIDGVVGKEGHRGPLCHYLGTEGVSWELGY